MDAPSQDATQYSDRTPRALTLTVLGVPVIADPCGGSTTEDSISSLVHEHMTSFAEWLASNPSIEEFSDEAARALTQSAVQVIAILNKWNGCAATDLIGGRWGFAANNPNLSRHQWNDKARSLSFEGPTGSIVSVFDSRNYGVKDDYAIIIKTDEEPVCVRTFERTPAGRWIADRGYVIFYSGGNNLDGKVSSIRFGRWW